MAKQALDNTYDIVVIGGGAAGASAAINAYARRCSVLILEAEAPFARMRRQPHAVNNYLGLPGVSSPELADAFERHLTALGIPTVIERAYQVIPGEDGFEILTDRNQYRSHALILCSGAVRAAGIAGEQALVGRGVSYCATCDGLLFSDRRVIVVGYYTEAEHDALTLSRIASQVRYLPLYGEPVLPLGEGIEVISGRPEQVVGEDRVTALRVSGQDLETDGIFIIRPSVPPASLVPGLELENGYVRVDRAQATNIPGVWAAGDITGPPMQYAKSAGEGQVAALSAERWLTARRRASTTPAGT